MPQKKYSMVTMILLLSTMVFAMPFSMDIYVPALPHISAVFNVSAGSMQMTLTVFMLATGLMQLIVGPLSDHFGRRSVSFYMTIIFSIGTLLCALSDNITQLILFRCIQAIGASGMMVIAFAIVRDVYSGRQSAEVYSFLNGIISFSPMFAPFIGSYLDVNYGWSSTFLALLVIAVAAMIVILFFLPETLQKTHRSPFNLSVITQYGKIAKNPIFLIYSTLSAMGLSYLYLFCSISPYVIIRLLHIPELHYGFYFCFMGISFFVGSFISGFVVLKYGVSRTVLSGMIITLIGGILMTTWYFITGLTIDNFIWPMLLIGIGGTFCLGAGSGGSMEPFSENIGAAAALGGAGRFLFSSAVGAIVIRDNVTSILPLSLPAIIFSIVGLIIFLTFRKKLKLQE